MKKTVRKISDWIEQKIEDAHAKGAIVGLSGGIDSAVTSALAVQALEKENVLGVIIPCFSNIQDQRDATLHANELEIEYKIVKLNKVYTSLLNRLTSSEASQLSMANLKARLRMCTLYFYANLYNYLVLDTCNKTEIAIGYFTKHGDGASDINPVGDLYKKDIYEVAKYLNINEKIINRVPTAGLWKDQTDEKEMKISYKQLDDILQWQDGITNIKPEYSQELFDRVKCLKNSSEHKRQSTPICKIYE